VVSVCAVRTGSGKSQTTRRVPAILRAKGRRVVCVRHPMPYGDLVAERVQRFATLQDLDTAGVTVEEREEYEAHIREGTIVYAGVDYGAILEDAQLECDVLLWDGGNNDLPFFRPDLHLTLVDALRPGHELAYHPGEANLRRADVIVVNKMDSAGGAAVEEVLANIRTVNPSASVVRATSPVRLSAGPPLAGLRVLVIEDGPTITHGGMPFGAGTVAAREAGATLLVDPHPYAVGSIAATYARYPAIGHVLPAMGYGQTQLDELAQTIRAADCDVVVVGTPVDLGRLVDLGHPARQATYTLEEIGTPDLRELLTAWLAKLPSAAQDRVDHDGTAP
jgi:predicted GTPase